MCENQSDQKIEEIVEELYDEFNEERIRLSSIYDKNLLSIKESEQYIQELSKNNETDFSIFSPRSIKVDNTEKIRSLEQKIDEIQEENHSISERLKYYDKKVEQLESIKSQGKEDCLNDDSSILKLLEIEKKRVSRELHDTTVQTLTHMVHKTELCMKYMDTDTIKAKLELELIHKGIKDIIDELRATIFQLRPSAYDDINFESAATQVIEEIKKTTDIKILYQLKGNYDNIDDMILISTIRIIQEACNNAIKYSEAKEIKVEINHTDHIVHIMIQDNGKGFDEKAIHKEEPINKFGITIMKERTKILNGKFELKTRKNKGTIINVSIPVPLKGEDKCQ